MSYSVMDYTRLLIATNRNTTNIMFLDIIHCPAFIYKHLPVYFSEHSVSGEPG
jgi:hypothetical protein